MAVMAILSAILKNEADHCLIGVPKMLCAKISSKFLAVLRHALDIQTDIQTKKPMVPPPGAPLLGPFT